MNNKTTATSNYNYHGNESPTECDECNSSMTLSDNGNYLVCDNFLVCDNQIKVESDDEQF